MSRFFITFEGGEGAGKSTQIAQLAEFLKQRNYAVETTREPGGTIAAEYVRELLLSGCIQHYGAKAEALLFAAARADHVDEFIIPALAKGKIVLCDRFIDSTRVYQGQFDNALMPFIRTLEKIAIMNVYPNLTFILDVPAEVGLKRANSRRPTTIKADRFEKDSFEVHEKRRAAFLEIGRKEPERCIIIDGTKTIDTIQKEIRTHVISRIGIDK